MKYAKDNRGFMLGELLVVVIIVGLLTATIAAGIPSVVSAFQRITRTANAQTVMSTAVNEIKGDLRYARTDDLASENGKNEPVFYNSDGYLMTYQNSAEGIKRVFYMGTDKAQEDDGNSTKTMYDAQPLLTERDQANGLNQKNKMIVKLENIQDPNDNNTEKLIVYNNGVYTIKVGVYNNQNDNKPTLETTVNVRALNE